jgi:DNA-binding beta-propeller fold protein YncE
MAILGQTLYIADSESNIIRAIDVASGQVKTLAGGDLFEFGDVDGTGDDVRLQHPLGLLAHGDKLLIADTYNHKIKELDPERKRVTSLLGTGKPGQVDGASPSFYEPGGLTLANEKLYIADTNNHAIRVVDLKTKQTRTLKINGLAPPARSFAAVETAAGPNAEEIKTAPQQLRAGANATLEISVELPPGYHLNPMAPQRYKVSVEETKALVVDEKLAARSAKDLKLPIRIPLNAGNAGSANLQAQVTLFYCREDNTGTCRIKTLIWKQPIQITTDATAANEVKLRGKLTVD